MCAMTGMPAFTTASAIGAKSSPPSSFTTSAPPSLTMRMALLIASAVRCVIGPSGRSPTRMARLTAREIALA